MILFKEKLTLRHHYEKKRLKIQSVDQVASRESTTGRDLRLPAEKNTK